MAQRGLVVVLGAPRATSGASGSPGLTAEEKTLWAMVEGEGALPMRQVLKEAFLVAMMVGGLMPRFLCRGIEAVR